jgi:hypothetical protein
MPDLIKKRYLGDGVFVAISGGMLVLTAEDGSRATNTIYLEVEVYQALVAFYQQAVAITEAAAKEH